MTTTHTFDNNTRWGHSPRTTSTLHRHPKRHNPTEPCLLDLLPQDVLTEIEFLESGLEHRDKPNSVITKIHPLLNPILVANPQNILSSYHNLGVYGSWYNKCHYTWEHWRVPTSTQSYYKNILACYSTVINTLTQRNLDFTTSVAACQNITLDGNSSIPYFELMIEIFYHATQILPSLPDW